MTTDVFEYTRDNWTIKNQCKQIVQALTILYAQTQNEDFDEDVGLTEDDIENFQEIEKLFVKYEEKFVKERSGREVAGFGDFIGRFIADPDIHLNTSENLKNIYRIFYSYAYVLDAMYFHEKDKNDQYAHFYLIKAAVSLGDLWGLLSGIDVGKQDINIHRKGGIAKALSYKPQKNKVREIWGNGHEWRYVRSRCVTDIVRNHPEITYSSADKWIKQIQNEQAILDKLNKI
jgi:hypothetical protein